MITVYSKPGCGGCTATVQHMTKIGLEFTKVDVTTDADAAQHLIDLGYSSLPVVVAGDQHWAGYRPDNIKGLVVSP